MKYAHQFSNKRTPQTQRVLTRSEQIVNNEGGYIFALSDMDRVKRFLILGSEGGSFYVKEQNLTIENAKALVRAIKEDGLKVVELITEVSDKGLASKNTPAIFALSLCMSEAYASLPTRNKAAQVLPKICRIGTHIFQFAEAIKATRGWGRLVRNAIASWYTTKDIGLLQYQLAKYQSRTTVEGLKNTNWSHRDLLRKSHPTPKNPEMSRLFKWVTSGQLSDEDIDSLPFINAVEQTKRCTTVKEIVKLIEKYRLPREFIPTKFLKNRKVLLAMLPHMPMTALVRNLGNLSANGVLVDGAWDEINLVTKKLTNQELIRKSRMHPIQALSALMTYSQGHGFRGNNKWHPVGTIKECLDDLFELSFYNVESTGKRTMLALDVSSSMGWENSTIPSIGITAREASAAMSMINFRKEQNSFIFAFSHLFKPISVSRKDSIRQVISKVSRLDFGRTDCSLPMIYAMENRIKIDTFVIYTDNETYAGVSHPFQALKEYRELLGINSRLVVVGMTSNGFSIADPKDPGMLDVVGFNTSTPSIISQFSKGEI